MLGKLAAGLIIAAGPSTSALAQTAGDAVKGKTQFLRCVACHAIAPGAPNKLGPGLSGIVGARAATRPNYTYSPAFRAAGFTWDDAKLSAFIERPAAAVKGNKMVFAGVADPKQRQDIIAYLKTLR